MSSLNDPPDRFDLELFAISFAIHLHLFLLPFCPADKVSSKLGAIYLAMDAWLATFAHRVSIGPSIFLASAAVALVAAQATVALQSYRTARGHPAEALRYE